MQANMMYREAIDTTDQDGIIWIMDLFKFQSTI